MGPQTEVFEGIVLVCRDNGAAGAFIPVLIFAFDQILDSLQLVWLVFEQFAGFIDAEDPVLERMTAWMIRRMRLSISGRPWGVSARGRSKS
jgi:hypothetical protein